MQVENPFPATALALPPPLAVKYCLYARKSSEAEEQTGLIDRFPNRRDVEPGATRGVEYPEMYRESHSAKDCGQRPVFNQLPDRHSFWEVRRYPCLASRSPEP